jgi:penicillin-binding protein
LRSRRGSRVVPRADLPPRSNIIVHAPFDQGRRLRQVQLVPDLADATGNTVYTLASDRVYRSTDFGQSWTSLAPIDGMYPSGLAAARRMVFIVDGTGGRLSTDAGKSWKLVGLPDWASTCAWIEGARRLYICSRISAEYDVGHLSRSRDVGATWESLEGPGFPRGLPVHVVRTAPSADATIYAGTDVGAYVSTDDGRSWSRLGAGLPWVAVRDLWLSPDGGRLLAATYGRGVWELRLSDKPPLPPAVSVTPASKAMLAGSETEFEVHVDGLGSFPALGLEGVPPLVHWSFSPPSSTSSVLKLSVDAGQPTGETRLFVTATSGMTTTRTPLDLSILSDGGHVSIVSLDPAVVALSAGRTTGVRIQVDATAPTTFEATSLPSGATVVFDPVSLPGSGTTMMTLRADPSSPDAQGTARVAARTLGQSATGRVEITVAARPSVRILSPVAGAPLTSPVEIAAEATFSAFAAAGKLDLFADDALVGAGQTSARVHWTGSSGTHVLLARAIDGRGETAETAVRVETGGSAPNDPPPDHLASSHGCGSAGADLLAMLGFAAAFRARRVRRAPSRIPSG